MALVWGAWSWVRGGVSRVLNASPGEGRHPPGAPSWGPRGTDLQRRRKASGSAHPSAGSGGDQWGNDSRWRIGPRGGVPRTP